MWDWNLVSGWEEDRVMGDLNIIYIYEIIMDTLIKGGKLQINKHDKYRCKHSQPNACELNSVNTKKIIHYD